ncbi:hypothetical protein RRG08_016517 [Elysia crispata]|uniref:Uncharacterized protein n=1 Tax=Elysia crispata TaxID=231223 RepID=A0AAE1E4G3_9GAST|nr:hypothetical protein RRG08_016517 [Elysia crispata]
MDLSCEGVSLQRISGTPIFIECLSTNHVVPIYSVGFVFIKSRRSIVPINWIIVATLSNILSLSVTLKDNVTQRCTCYE